MVKAKAWRHRIKALARMDKANHDAFNSRLLKAKEDALDWPACAVGECLALEEDYDLKKISPRLRHLGAQFYQNVANAEWLMAERTIADIELVSEAEPYGAEGGTL